MPTTFTKEDIVLLGYATTEQKHNGSAYDVFDATTTVGLETVTTRFIYLKARCSVATAERAAQDWGRSTKSYVIKAKSTPVTIQRLKHLFGPNHEVRDQDELVWTVLSSKFSDYLKKISERVPHEDHFIPPRLSRPDIGNSLEAELLNYLTARSPERDNGTLKVLSANAGVGKTTLSRHLIHTLVERINERKTIPVYVEAQHWQTRLNIGSVEELWDVIDNSIRMFGAPTLQMTETLFQHALRQGYFCFIFDGFDELCSGASTHFEPSSILKELSSAVSQSEARILLTTRTLFWNTQIIDKPKNVEVWSLDAFNVQQVKGYFIKVFRQGTPNHRAAMQLYSEMRKQAKPREKTGSIRDQFINLPLCVRMIADYVRRGGTSVSVPSDEPLVKSFLKGICEREINRKELNTSAEGQIRSFEDVALAYPSVNPTFPIGDLFLAPEGFSETDSNKIDDHALLACDDSDNQSSFRFRYEFVAPLLRAIAISRWIRDKGSSANSLPLSISTLALEAGGKGPILEQLLNFLVYEDLEYIFEKGRIITSEYAHSAVAAREKAYIGSFFFHVAQSIVSNQPRMTKRDRAKSLFSGIGGTTAHQWSRVVESWAFRGPIIGLDLRNVSFRKCAFRDVTFSKCTADRSTRFVGCLFEGNLDFEQGTGGWKQAVLDDCNLEFPAVASWENILDKSFGDKDSRARQLLRIGLRKFWYHGNFRGSVIKSNWQTGALGHTGHGKTLLNAMLKEGLVESIMIGGTAEGGLAFDRHSIGDLQNYMDNNQMSGKVEAVYQRLRTQLS